MKFVELYLHAAFLTGANPLTLIRGGVVFEINMRKLVNTAYALD